MRIRWRNFELPTQVTLDSNSSDEGYGKFYAEPFERGFGATIGNGLRRVLLSSIEGTALTSIRIDGVQHEFSSIEGVYEDVTDIVLNLKKLRIKLAEEIDNAVLEIDTRKKGDLTGADILCDQHTEVINKDLHICSCTDEIPFRLVMQLKRGRGYVTADENIDEDSDLGTIPIDSVYSPVYRVKFGIENTRVGKITNYDRLILEIWTDGTVTPEQALTEASKIYRKHLNPFVQYKEVTEELSLEPDFLVQPEDVEEEEELDEEKLRIKEILERPLESLDLSVRARNCLDTEDIRCVCDLVAMSDNDILKVKNFGKTSMKEVKQKLESMGLALGMDLSSFY